MNFQRIARIKKNIFFFTTDSYCSDSVIYRRQIVWVECGKKYVARVHISNFNIISCKSVSLINLATVETRARCVWLHNDQTRRARNTCVCSKHLDDPYVKDKSRDSGEAKSVRQIADKGLLLFFTRRPTRRERELVQNPRRGDTETWWSDYAV